MKCIRINDTNNNYWSDVWNIYTSSFPIFEQRTLENQIEALKDDRYNCIVICDEGLVVGILLYWEFDKYKYIEHLAISSELRGKNYGSRILEKFCDDNSIIILEIDPPIDEIGIKRLRFYSKIGFILQEFNHVHPPYRKGYEGHSLKVMCYNKNLEKYEYDVFNEFLRNVIMTYSECN
ncbi:GNAT family N-acetyltransferase [Romboutsia ilealis]|uniref:GNAT family N-acetyltransferase n=1 Tax=Romboutsia faecis TaxID=2764597 RepID=A0ABR7JJT8_9FIRM|nr:GNAT family N-acetyltransferase [Romboutsia faecis]MBC5995176.1 GNAT family N-acetyltransferase [Romboutsia faecis]MRN25894.1 GNAT family N-acetyltransferase [Romboutsia ilealis]